MSKRTSGKISVAILIAHLITTFCRPVAAQEEGRKDYLPVVTAVQVEGNLNISKELILNKVKLKRGQVISRELINQDLKRLYSTGFFKDVKVDLVPDDRDFRVVFIVDEKPVVKDISVEGNTVFKTRSLLKEVGLSIGQSLDQKLLKEGIQNIEEKYRKRGFRFIFVEDNVTVNEDTREAAIRITIKEGRKFKIKEIQFEGNNSFTDKKMRRLLKTKKDGWINSGAFHEGVFEDDVDRLKLFYQSEGYLDVEINPIVNYDNATNQIFIEVHLQEGKQYQAGEVRLEGANQFSPLEIMDRLTMTSGSVYSPGRLSDDLNIIKKYYFEKGHVDALIDPQMEFNKETGRVNIIYQIQEGTAFFIDKIRIRGNTKTKDTVIRRELRVYPGEKINGERLDYSVQRLKDLNYFEDISYDLEPGETPSQRDLVFKVKEKQTGELSFGGGFSSVESFVGFVELSQNNFDISNWPNFTGDGQKLSIRGRWGSVSRDLDVSFLEPYLFDTPYSFGIQGYNFQEDVSKLDFNTQRTGATMTFGREITDRLSTSLAYTFEHVELDEISSDAGADVLLTDPSANLSKLRWSISYDKRNSKVIPTKGYQASFSSEMVGSFIGGSEDYYSFIARYNQYWSFWKEHVLEFKAKLGVMNEFGDSDRVPVYDRFYAGGLGSVRGFDFREIGPQQGGNPVGGETLSLFSLEYTFPLLENFKGAAFIDVGHVNSKAYKVDFDEFAVSIGPGLLVNTPIGPIVFYYGYPIANAGENENGRFEFSFKRGF